MAKLNWQQRGEQCIRRIRAELNELGGRHGLTAEYLRGVRLWRFRDEGGAREPLGGYLLSDAEARRFLVER